MCKEFFFSSSDRTATTKNQGNSTAPKGEIVNYKFVEGVRELLIDSVPTPDVDTVLEVVSQYIARKAGISIKNFAALLSSHADWDEKTQQEIIPFAEVASQVLRRLGGEYAELAEELERKSQVIPKPPDVSNNFPELQTFEFEVATISIEHDTGFISVQQPKNSESQKQRIALISIQGDPASSNIGTGETAGQDIYVRNVGEALGQLGWEVDIFTRKVSAKQETIVQHSENCRTIRLQAGELEFIPRDDLFEYLPEFIDNFLEFQAKNGFTYSLIHTNYWLSSWVGMQLKKIQGSKQVHTYHSLGAVKYNTIENIPLIANQRLAVEKEVLETAERIVATSPQEKQHMRELLSTKGYIDVIPCGTDIQRFGSIDRQTARLELGIASDAKVVLYVGRFDPRKGIETLVRAVAESKLRANENLQLIIGGGSRPGQSDGIERDRIESIVKELGISDITTFTGRLSQEILPTYYAAADVCVVPSHYEPFGLVAIEAMACCTPVVASDVGGLQYTVVPEETGLLAPPQDVPAFAAAIDRILQNPEWAQKLGKGGRKRVESKFSWDGVATQLSELYTELLVSQPVSATAMELVQSTAQLVQSTAKELMQSTVELVQSTAKKPVLVTKKEPVKELVHSTAELVQSTAKKIVINRTQRTVQYYVEDLGNEIGLEMVLIPGGSFMMGSPEDELERSDSESPQHLVNIKPFCMGKYPVTQVQWQAVAALPQFSRELDADPSRFKGKNLPVEGVSWYDVSEFCKFPRSKIGKGRENDGVPAQRQAMPSLREASPTASFANAPLALCIHFKQSNIQPFRFLRTQIFRYAILANCPIIPELVR